MGISKKLKSFLEANHVEYQPIHHEVAYTAQEAASAERVPGKQVIKSVIVKVDGQFVMCVLAAIHMVDLEKIRNITGDEESRLATEEEMKDLFPDYEVGTEPPLGNLYGLDVYFDEFLENDEEVVFNAGTYADAVKMKYVDLVNLVKPKIADFSKAL